MEVGRLRVNPPRRPGKPALAGLLFHFLKLAQHLAAGSPFARELAQVRIYRGQPDSKLDPRGYSASRRQISVGTVAVRDSRDTTAPLPLRLARPVRTWGEASRKGIDVVLSLDFAMLAVAGTYDAGILFSMDTDMKPALEAVADLTNKHGSPRVREVAAWSCTTQHNQRLAIKTCNLYSHWIAKTPIRPWLMLWITPPRLLACRG